MQIYFISRRLLSDIWRLNVLLFSTSSNINHEPYKFRKKLPTKQDTDLSIIQLCLDSLAKTTVLNLISLLIIVLVKKKKATPDKWLLLDSITKRHYYLFYIVNEEFIDKEAGSLFTWCNFLKEGWVEAESRGRTHISECCVCPLCKDLVLFQ